MNKIIHRKTFTLLFTVNKLEDLKDYMEHKELTMERIKQLEQQLESCKMTYENQMTNYKDEMEIERQK